jgi:meso-butanediol dehydrogenase / (S,S)-butanediol dehydrogenase / diacetyl reductase
MADVLAGKMALVTGASSGLGRAVTEILHSRGAQVFGIARDKEKLRQSMVEVVGADLAVNLNGPFFLSRAALPHLLERGGNIVNVSSIAGLEGQAYSAGYCAAKHGLIGLTRAMAMEFTGKSLRVNAICPGGMMTPQVTGFTFPDGVDFDLVMKVASPRGLMEAEDVAKMVAFVASDDASAIHGAVYSVDNGKMA